MRGPALFLVVAVACAAGTDRPPPLKLWHTFGPEETTALNQALPTGVEATVLPFGRAMNRLEWTLHQGGDNCPDLARIDATWLPGLAAHGRIQPLPDEDLLAGMTPEAVELARWRDATWGIPQAVDGLALIWDQARVQPATTGPWPPLDLAGLEKMATSLTQAGRYGISIRADGYWFLPFLWAVGADVMDPDADTLGVDRPEAALALRRYAALPMTGVAPPPEPGGDEAATEGRRFASGEVALIIGGPWTVAALMRAAAKRRHTLDLRIAALPPAPDGRPAAPRGGQLYVVPSCARHPAEAWMLAVKLTEEKLQATWSHRLGVVPTRTGALAKASALARAFASTLERTRALPRHPLMPYLFDDLTPAIEATLAGDATADEALAGTGRAWRRLNARPLP